MHQEEGRFFDPARQSGKEVRRGGGEPGARPETRRGGVRVERGDVGAADGAKVVVARNADADTIVQALDTLVRLGAVTHDISKNPERVGSAPPGGIAQHRVKRTYVRVDVRKHEAFRHGQPLYHRPLAFVGYEADGIIAAMKLSALGEFGLIELIRDVVQSSHDPSTQAHRRILIDIGDDAAAWTGTELVQLATTDALVENVHFRFEWSSWADLGHKSLAVNLSDIAAMGGAARYALVSLSCPSDVESDDVISYYRAMCALAIEHGVVIIGGNLTASPFVTSTVFVTGEAPAGRLLLRSSAAPGDLIAVTGELGAASAALSLLGRAGASQSSLPGALLSALFRPLPRLREALVLVEEGVRCAIDISDGLVADLGHICARSGVSATVDAASVPTASACRGVTPDALRCALTGGEDYELLFTCNAAQLERITTRLSCRVTAIGRIVGRAANPGVTVVGQDGRPFFIKDAGWNHFGR